jgi:DNA-directed RNA polymerase subunit beta
VLVRALGIGTDEEIIDRFGDEPKLRASFAKDPSHDFETGLLELYKKIRPGEPLSVESADSLINSMFFDSRRYDLAKVGRYKFNKKLAMRSRITGHVLAEDVVDEANGDILGSAGETVTREMADLIQNAAVPYVMIRADERDVKVLSNLMVDLTHYVDCDPAEFGITEKVYYPALREILVAFQESDSQDPEALGDMLRRSVHEQTTHSCSERYCAPLSSAGTTCCNSGFR